VGFTARRNMVIKTIFLDDNDNEVPPEKAIHAIRAEYDDNGTLLSETWYFVREKKKKEKEKKVQKSK
jgi:hypothetical protein